MMQEKCRDRYNHEIATRLAHHQAVRSESFMFDALTAASVRLTWVRDVVSAFGILVAEKPFAVCYAQAPI